MNTSKSRREPEISGMVEASGSCLSMLLGEPFEDLPADGNRQHQDAYGDCGLDRATCGGQIGYHAGCSSCEVDCCHDAVLLFFEDRAGRDCPCGRFRGSLLWPHHSRPAFRARRGERGALGWIMVQVVELTVTRLCRVPCPSCFISTRNDSQQPCMLTATWCIASTPA